MKCQIVGIDRFNDTDELDITVRPFNEHGKDKLAINDIVELHATNSDGTSALESRPLAKGVHDDLKQVKNYISHYLPRFVGVSTGREHYLLGMGDLDNLARAIRDRYTRSV